MVGGKRYGPISEEELRRWVAEGRVRPNDPVWTEGMAEWAPAGPMLCVVLLQTNPLIFFN